MVYKGLQHVWQVVDWHNRRWHHTLHIPVDSKLIAIRTDKIRTDCDGGEDQHINFFYLAGKADKHGVDVMLINTSDYDAINSAEWEFVCSDARKDQVVFLFRKLEGR